VDFYGFDFTPATVLAFVVAAWTVGLFIGAVCTLLASLARR
jgi:hypothetical protein